MSRTRIKICGITRPEDALLAARSGADAIGLVFYDRSPRTVSIEQAREITAALPPFIMAVGLFVDADRDQLDSVLAQVPLGILQFHGDESPESCQLPGMPYIKALRVRPDLDIGIEARRYASACGLLLDSYQDGVPGGTGQSFNWADVPAGLKKPIILAGGLTAANVAKAIQTVRPYAVDVSSGVEAGKGIKDPVRVRQFIAAVHDADGRFESTEPGSGI